MPYLSFVAQHFAKGMLLSLPMYLQVSGLSGVLFSWKKLLGNPLNFGANLIMNAMRVKLLPCSILCPWPRLTDTTARVGAEI